MVEENIVLGHKISFIGIEVDKAKIYVITKIPLPNGVRSFLVIELNNCIIYVFKTSTF